MTEDEKAVIAAIVAFALLSAFVAACVTGEIWKSWSVRVNIADYDAKTGEWTLRPEFREKE